MTRIAALALALACACSVNHGTAFPRAMGEADDASARGDLRGAAEHCDEAARVAILPRDRDEARHAAARLLARAGDTREALARFDALKNEQPAGPEAGSAAYDAALLRLQTGDDEGGWRDVEALLRRFPDDGDARPALRLWLRHLRDTGVPGAALAWLRRVQPALDRSDRSEEIAYAIAEQLEADRDFEGARNAYRGVAARFPYPRGALWDDALLRASKLDEELGLPNDAIADLDTMLERRERAWIVGSAERSHYAEAELRRGEIYRDRLGDHAKARAAFHSLYANFPDSTLRDRGLYEEAALLRADGDVAGSCARLATLVETLPGSRYVPCARVHCPNLAPASHPGTGEPPPATCHEYLEHPR